MPNFRRLIVLVLGTLAGLIVLVGVGYVIFTNMFLTVPKNINVGIQFIPDKLNNEELSKEYVAMRLDTEENLGCHFPNELKVSTSFHRDTAQVKIKGYRGEAAESSNNGNE